LRRIAINNRRSTLSHVHLLGIGGAAMAPVAGLLKERGYRVTGSDAGVYPPASTLLKSLRIQWNEKFDAVNLKPAPDLAVVGNVIARGNPEIEYILEERIPYCSMAHLLEDLFIAQHNSIVVAGTHGKTTTTAMLAWIFHVARKRPSFLVGGVLPNFDDRSYALGTGDDFIVEGDEYETAFFDRGPKFLHYRPNQLVITSLEYDHADIYPNLESIAHQFRLLVNLVPRTGRVVVWGESKEARACAEKAFCPIETFGASECMDWFASDIKWENGATRFQAKYGGRTVAHIRLPMAGRHNVLDALAAVAVAHGRGIRREAIEKALASFQGVRKRMEIKGEAGGVLVVEDFAHHPTAMRVTIEAARTRWPERKLWVAFEPRSNTMRRKIFEDVLPEALSDADAVMIGPVNRANLLSDTDRISPQRIVMELVARGKESAAFGSAAEIAQHIAGAAGAGDLVLVMSNGSFDGLSMKLLDLLENHKG
jgi:UDP-N-acetylmuramate: L-alanyl-gamma-D-glutamyl-meso-diaminopimelate ligase